MKTHLFILALVALWSGTPVLADGDVGSNGQGSDRGDIRGDVGGNGQGTGDIMGDVGGNGQGGAGGPGTNGEGDVGGNGQGSGTEFQVGRRLQFYAAAVQQANETTRESDVLLGTSRLIEVMARVIVKSGMAGSQSETSTDRFGAGVLDPSGNELTLKPEIFDALTKYEKTMVLTHHLGKAAGIEEETVAKPILKSLR